MKSAIIAAAALCGTAVADNLIAIPGGFTWSGGVAIETANGWIGSGWDRFPGVNPPWNPIAMPIVPQGTSAPVPPPVTVRECAQVTIPVAKPTVIGHLRICGGDVPVIRLR
jgi:hypothetical protein